MQNQEGQPKFEGIRVRMSRHYPGVRGQIQQGYRQQLETNAHMWMRLPESDGKLRFGKETKANRKETGQKRDCSNLRITHGKLTFEIKYVR